MTRPKTCITNLSTGEVIVREYNDDEMIAHNALLQSIADEAAQAEAQAAAKAAAQSKLAALGLTIADLEALGL